MSIIIFEFIVPFYCTCLKHFKIIISGDHSSSVDSGVGASVSRSIDEGPCGSSEEVVNVAQKRPSSLPAPPPLLPKSRSLDHNLSRDSHGDSEMVTLKNLMVLKII